MSKSKPRFLIVFCHGVLGFSHKPLVGDYFRGIVTKFDEHYHVIAPQVSPVGSIEDRACELNEAIEGWFANPKNDKKTTGNVHLIGHSMGGLDCRRVVHITGRTYKVLSITTISTPHYGSPTADMVAEILESTGPLDNGLREAVALLFDSKNSNSLDDLRPERAAMFNITYPNKPDIRYYSAGAVVNLDSLNIDIFKVLSETVSGRPKDLRYRRAYGPNDGVVATQSARWGKYLVTMDDTNHMGMVRWRITSKDLLPGAESPNVLKMYERIVEIVINDAKPGRG